MTQSSQLRQLALLVAIVAVGASACLTTHYELSASEIERLASLDPSQRGEKVKVKQRVDYGDMDNGEVADDDPGWEEAEFDDAIEDEFDPEGYDEESFDYAPDAYESNVVIVDIHAHGHGHGVRPARRVAARGGRTARPTPRPTPRSVPVTRAPRTTRPRTPSSSSSGSSGSGALALFGKTDSSADVVFLTALAVVAVAAVGAGAITLAVTEGAKYDGWVKANKNQTVYFQRPTGVTTTVRLSELTADHARLGQAYLSEEDLTSDQLLLRRPLVRTGFNLRFELGTTEMRVPGEDTAMMPSAHIGLGYFPIDELGFSIFFRPSGGRNSGPVFSSRYGGMVEGFALKWQGVHFGLFGWAGAAFDTYDGDGDDHTSQYFGYGGGILSELDITTTLAATLRLGVDMQMERDGVGNEPAFMSTLGFAVY